MTESPNKIECDYVECDSVAKLFVVYVSVWRTSSVMGACVCDGCYRDNFGNHSGLEELSCYDLGHINFSVENTPKELANMERVLRSSVFPFEIYETAEG